MSEINEFIAVMGKLDASFVIVSNEVGMGLVPETRLGRIYRDMLGKANQLLASHVTEVYLMVACLPVKIKG
jgi:adenosylcobinamide kinase/adenosylcobinamide-phosphate guanylyltransferase